MILECIELKSIPNITISCSLCSERAWQRIHERWGQGRLRSASNAAVRVADYRTVNECCGLEVFPRCDTEHHHHCVKIALNLLTRMLCIRLCQKPLVCLCRSEDCFIFNPLLLLLPWPYRGRSRPPDLPPCRSNATICRPAGTVGERWKRSDDHIVLVRCHQ
jgi:hypothetical protein